MMEQEQKPEPVSTKVLEVIGPYLLRSIEALAEQLREDPVGFCQSVKLTSPKIGGECRIEAAFALRPESGKSYNLDELLRTKQAIFVDIGVDVPMETIVLGRLDSDGR
jgi:hypothetical protein